MACLPLAILSVASFHESLWVDELHTSWTISGEFSEIASRAQAGNQSPLYFWALKLWTEMLGPADWILRLPSWFASVAVVGLATAIVLPGRTRDEVSGPISRLFTGRRVLCCLAIGLWFGLDRIQTFYASEARVYALLQLVVLIGWASAVRAPGASKFAACVWCLASVVAVALHIVSLVAVVWQMVVIVACQLKRPADSSKVVQHQSRWLAWWLAIAIVIVAAAIQLWFAFGVWERRQQWASFAGDASLLAFIHLFSFLPLLVPVIAGQWISRLRSAAGDQDAQRDAKTSDPSTPRWVWWIAAFAPCVTVWAVTGLGIAPMMHRRYLVYCAAPLVILAVQELRLVRSIKLQGCALAVSLVWLILSQGTLANWQQGQVVGWHRLEGWRSAVAWINEDLAQAASSKRPAELWPAELWCASNLIEGNALSLPIDPDLERYLSFPARGTYRVADPRGKLVPVFALANERRPTGLSSSTWLAQWQLHEEQAQSRGQSGSSLLVYAIYRGTADDLQRRLSAIARQIANDTTSAAARDAGQGAADTCRLEFSQPTTVAFGRVAVAKLRLHW